MQDLGSDRDGLEEQLRGSVDELNRLRRERQTMARQVAVSSEKLEIAQMEVEALTRDKKRLQQLLDQLRSGGLPAKGSGAEGDKVEGAEAQAIIRELRAALRAVQPQVKEQQVEINQLRAEREVLESQAESTKVYFQGQLRGRLNELQSAEAEVQRLQEAVDQQEAEAGRLEASNAALYQRLRELEESLASPQPSHGQAPGPQAASTTAPRAGAGVHARPGTKAAGAYGGGVTALQGAMGWPVVGGRMPGGPPLPTQGAPKRPRSTAAWGFGAGGGMNATAAGATGLAWGSGKKWAPGAAGSGVGVPDAGGRVTPGGTVYQRPRSQARGAGGHGALKALAAPVQLLPPEVMNQLLGLGGGGARPSSAAKNTGPNAPNPHAASGAGTETGAGLRAEQIGGGVDDKAQGLGWGRGMVEDSSLSRPSNSAIGEATFAAATLAGDLDTAGAGIGTLGASTLGLGLVAAYDRRKLQSREAAVGGSPGGYGGACLLVSSLALIPAFLVCRFLPAANCTRIANAHGTRTEAGAEAAPVFESQV